ncbi:MAG TPA: M28 family peptidase, partial [Chitinophagaceae bacterium]|nr:M28 family peptidase [Chitinophagaceae bacterium]
MRTLLVTGFLIISICVHSQSPQDISVAEVSRIEKALASDSMQGRKVYTAGIKKAAAFIANEFREAGLKPLPGANDFTQTFEIVDPQSTEATITLDGISVDKKNLVAFSAESSATITQNDQYKKVLVKNIADFGTTIFKYMDANENVIILVDTSLKKHFDRLAGFHMPQFNGRGNRIYILTSINPREYRIVLNQKIQKQELTNIAGIIPGKSKPDEYVIFSAHYDHLGIGMPDEAGDSIYNGANDDASGTTAVLALARYFSKTHDNERTLIFTTFTAEEIGEFGSAYFSRNFDPDKVVAMLNIEMIGTESKWGKNSTYITGFDKSDMGVILQKNLGNTPFKFYPDPYPEQQ